MAERIETRVDTLKNFRNANPVLAIGEQGIELAPNGIFSKAGDGFTYYNDLKYNTYEILINGISIATNINFVDIFVPTRTTHLINDSVFVTHEEIINMAVLRFMGSVLKYSMLPKTGNKTGDVWNIIDGEGIVNDGANAAWTKSGDWDFSVGMIDLSVYYKKTETYTQTEVKNLLTSTLASYYTKVAADAALAAALTLYYKKTETYTQTEVKNLLTSTLASYYTKVAADAALAAALTLYYKKTETYTQTEINNLITSSTGNAKRYTLNFNNTTNWSAVSNYFSISIPNATHKMGVDFISNVYILNSLTYKIYYGFPDAGFWIEVDTSGNFFIRSFNKFAGKVVLIG